MKLFAASVISLVLLVNVHAKSPITVFLAGDSTMAEKTADKRPETGWGEMLVPYFDATEVKVENHAKNGRSTRSFIAEKLWQTLIERVKAGDYVFIQFGHNDEKENTERYASPADYRTNLLRFVMEVRAKKAFPVLLTPVVRRRFDEKGSFYDTHGSYPDVVRSVASELKVPLIDMHRKSEAVLREYGAEKSKMLFLQLKPNENPNYPQGIEDNTHFNPRGAEVMAQIAVEGIKEQKLGLAKYLKTAVQP